NDRVLAMVPLFTRSGLNTGLLAPLAGGACSLPVPGFDGDRFIDWLQRLKPTTYSANPAMQRAVLDALARHPSGRIHNLRYVRTSSTAMSEETQAALEAALGVPVVQGYGSTEAGSIAQNPLPPGTRRAGSAGLATGAEILIASDAGEALPMGEI